jgi:hypothetical protein
MRLNYVNDDEEPCPTMSTRLLLLTFFAIRSNIVNGRLVSEKTSVFHSDPYLVLCGIICQDGLKNKHRSCVRFEVFMA